MIDGDLVAIPLGFLVLLDCTVLTSSHKKLAEMMSETLQY